MRSLLFFALLTLIACSPAVDRMQVKESAIVAGEEVQADSDLHHSTVGLILPRANDACTGVLIAENLVLTAAHCAEEIRGAQVYVGSAEYDESRFREIVDVRVHEKFEEMSRNSKKQAKDWHDIAILRLDGKPLPNTKPATLVANPQVNIKELPIILVGYGITDMTTQDASLVLRHANVRLSDPNFSSVEFAALPFQGAGTCHGDSGGPVYARIRKKLVVIGLTSRSLTPEGAHNCLEGSIYTKVSSFKNWIMKATRELGVAPSKLKFH